MLGTTTWKTSSVNVIDYIKKQDIYYEVYLTEQMIHDIKTELLSIHCIRYHVKELYSIIQELKTKLVIASNSSTKWSLRYFTKQQLVIYNEIVDLFASLMKRRITLQQLLQMSPYYIIHNASKTLTTSCEKEESLMSSPLAIANHSKDIDDDDFIYHGFMGNVVL